MTPGGTGKGISAMPTPGSKRAPLFEGDVEELLDFFVEFEELAGDCQLKDQEKVKMVVRYVTKEIKRFWKSLEGYKTGKFEDLKKSVMAEYPGADKGERYTLKQEVLREVPTDRGMVGRPKCYHSG